MFLILLGTETYVVRNSLNPCTHNTYGKNAEIVVKKEKRLVFNSDILFSSSDTIKESINLPCSIFLSSLDQETYFLTTYLICIMSESCHFLVNFVSRKW